MKNDPLWMDVAPRSAAIFVPDDTRIRNYRFFKPRNLGEKVT
jgi:hypothetical protein